MNKETLVLWLIEKLINSWETNQEETKEQLPTNLLGKYVILRGYDSWVHFWKLEYASKWLYRLSESRRLWRWWALKWIWLTSVALYWLAIRDEVKICWKLWLIEITDERICEIIPCSDEAIKSIKEYKEFTP